MSYSSSRATASSKSGLRNRPISRHGLFLALVVRVAAAAARSDPQMAEGAFVVSRDKGNPRDIHFQLSGGLEGDVPEDQAELRNEVDHALTVLRGIFPDDGPRFEEYFRSLLSLSQFGLVGATAQPKVARQALASLRADITAREAGRIKNQYMKSLGKSAAWIGLPAFAIGAMLAHLEWADLAVTHLFYLIAGCMAGVWLSFGSRKTTIGFGDLHILEEDRLEPFIRLVFAGLLSFTIGLLFVTDAVEVQVGSLSTSQISTSSYVALLLGLACGISEQALSTTVTKRAAQFIEF